MIKSLLKKLSIYKTITKIYDWIKFNYEFIKLLWKLQTNKGVSVFFFFPFYHTGGAEWVHYKIVQSIALPKLVFFTHSSANGHYKKFFSDQAAIFEIKPFLTKPYYRKVLKNILKREINHTGHGVVFGCHTQFFYEMLPLLSSEVKKIDLLHAFTGDEEPGAEKYSLPFVTHLDRRVAISSKTKDDLKVQYAKNGLEKAFVDKIEVIENCVAFSCESYPEKSSAEFKILYVGRNSPEKRIDIIGAIASRLKTINNDYQVVMIGENLADAVHEENRKDCIFLGGINDMEVLKKYYKEASAVIITSHREGFPMVIMEGMVCGAVPVSTNVGGIAEHVEDGVLGFLIDSNAIDIVGDFVNAFKRLRDEAVYRKMSIACYEYSKLNFSELKFKEQYQKLLSA